LEQIAIIDAMLARPQGATIGEMAERMECHMKTVQRHILWMADKFSMRIAHVGFETGWHKRLVYPLGQDRIFTKQAAGRLL
jgi:hypothetical protein